MKTLTLLLLAPILFAPADLGFHPEPSSTLTKVFTTGFVMDIGDLDLTMGGEDASEMMGIELPEQISGSMELVLKDTYAEVEDGEVTALVREFVSHESESDGMGDEEGEDRQDDLVGRTVRFDLEDGEYVASFDDEEDEHEEYLELMSHDCDMLAFLPDEDVEEGDSWRITAGSLHAFLDPGFDAEKDLGGEDDEVPAELLEQLETLRDGAELELTWKDTEEGIARLEVELDEEIIFDLAELLLMGMQDQELPAGIEFDVALCDLEVVAKAEGELLWDLAAGHLRAFELELTGELVLEAAVNVEAGAGGPTFDMEAAGSAEFTFTREVALR